MNITQLSNLYIGNFTPYPRKRIVMFLKEQYNICVHNMWLFNNAMDNTVLDIDNDFILKIYETKSYDFLKNAIVNYLKFKDFYAIRLLENINFNNISFLSSKPAILYKKNIGEFISNPIELSSHLALFHKAGFVCLKSFNLQMILSPIKKKIDLYFTPNVSHNISQENRLNLYNPLINKVLNLPLNKIISNVSYGIVHGDCSPNNFIKSENRILFLDFDSIRQDYQFLDLTDLLLKYSDLPNEQTDLEIVKNYLKITGHSQDIDVKSFCSLLNIVSCFRGIEMALSTEYYCFDKKKFSREVMNKYFIRTILSLLQNIEIRLEMRYE